ncbi:MAG: spondin domain-containing protein [Candidatus Competibacteraceae bacterium]|nr:spondin domain-containing protein [Candidatus Competibacteraceae bacterium]
MKFSNTALASLLLAIPLAGANAQSVARFGDQNSTYEVTVTNVTRGAFFTPILVVSHRPDVSLFTLGQPASAEMAILAEGGDIAPLAQALRADSRVASVANSEGLLEPGRSVTVRVPAQGTDRISLAAMILPTNDGFIALNGVSIPRSGSQAYMALGYDAGSEPNDELCESIPGPQCGGDGPSPSVGGENFVHVHAGIHGIADLKADEYDWRNPMAAVTIKRVIQ